MEKDLNQLLEQIVAIAETLSEADVSVEDSVRLQCLSKVALQLLED